MKEPITITILCCVIWLFSCCSSSKKETEKKEEIHIGFADYTEDALRWADSIIMGMSDEEIVGQLVVPAVFSAADESTINLVKEYASDYKVGGLVLLKGTVEEAKEVVDNMKKFSKIPPFISIDAETGLAMRLKDAPEFPSFSEISQKTSDQVMYDYGYELARECRCIGINVVLGPVADVVSSSRSVMAKRSLGRNPKRVASLSVSFGHGLEDGGVMSVAKHFPGHGRPLTDSHKTLPVIEGSLMAMMQTDLFPFRQWINERLSAIMIGHLWMPAIDPIKRSAAASEVVMTDFLRNELEFSGLIITDALTMGGAEASATGMLQSLKAGADIVLSPKDTPEQIKRVIKGVKDGEISMSILKEKCRRVLFYKYKFALEETESDIASENLNISRVRKISSELMLN